MSLRRLKQEIVEELKKEIYSIIEEALVEEGVETENAFYRLYQAKSGSKQVFVLQVTEDGWEKIKEFFDNSNYDGIKKGNTAGVTLNLKGKDAVYDLFAQPVKYADGTIKYRIYGASGDYTIGLPPSYFSLRYNRISDSKKILTDFVQKVF